MDFPAEAMSKDFRAFFPREKKHTPAPPFPKARMKSRGNEAVYCIIFLLPALKESAWQVGTGCSVGWELGLKIKEKCVFHEAETVDLP